MLQNPEHGEIVVQDQPKPWEAFENKGGQLQKARSPLPITALVKNPSLSPDPEPDPEAATPPPQG